MSEQTNPNPSLADGLIQAEGGSARPTATLPVDPTFEALLEEEKRFETRVRTLAVRSWAATFVCLILFAAAFIVVRNGGGFFVEVIRGAILVISVTGVVSLCAAAVTSLTWLLRSRTPTLRAIERRLAALERRLMARESTHRESGVPSGSS